MDYSYIILLFFIQNTGAGKSSLMLCLLRLVEPELEGENKKGPIMWDGVDTSKLNLNTLRTKIGTFF